MTATSVYLITNKDGYCVAQVCIRSNSTFRLQPVLRVREPEPARTGGGGLDFDEQPNPKIQLADSIATRTEPKIQQVNKAYNMWVTLYKSS